VYYYAIFQSDCKGWNDGRAGEAVKHVHGWSTACAVQNDPARTASVYRGDFYVTGDCASKDDDGYFWFSSRVDDVINSSGCVTDAGAEYCDERVCLFVGLSVGLLSVREHIICGKRQVLLTQFDIFGENCIHVVRDILCLEPHVYSFHQICRTESTTLAFYQWSWLGLLLAALNLRSAYVVCTCSFVNDDVFSIGPSEIAWSHVDTIPLQ